MISSDPVEIHYFGLAVGLAVSHDHERAIDGPHSHQGATHARKNSSDGKGHSSPPGWGSGMRLLVAL